MNREDLHRSIHYVQKVLFPLALVTFERDGSGRSKILKKQKMPNSWELHAPSPVSARKTMPKNADFEDFDGNPDGIGNSDGSFLRNCACQVGLFQM